MGGSRKWVISGVVAGFAVALATVGVAAGCTSPDEGRPADGSHTRMVGIFGERPRWGAEEMVQRSDAVVIGELARKIGVKRAQDRSGEPPRYYHRSEDYEMIVERVLFSNIPLPPRIAVSVEGEPVGEEGYHVTDMDPGPDFRAGERVLLFLGSLQDEEFGEGPARPVPDGFTEETYYQAIIGGSYGKLVPHGLQWRDSRTYMPMSIGTLELAIERRRAAGR